MIPFIKANSKPILNPFHPCPLPLERLERVSAFFSEHPFKPGEAMWPNSGQLCCSLFLPALKMGTDISSCSSHCGIINQHVSTLRITSGETQIPGSSIISLGCARPGLPTAGLKLCEKISPSLFRLPLPVLFVFYLLLQKILQIDKHGLLTLYIFHTVTYSSSQ